MGKIFLVKGSPSIPQVLQDPKAKHLRRIKKIIKTRHNKRVYNWHFSFCLPWGWSSNCCLPTIRSQYNPLNEISWWPNPASRGREGDPVPDTDADGSWEKMAMWEPHGSGEIKVHFPYHLLNIGRKNPEHLLLPPTPSHLKLNIKWPNYRDLPFPSYYLLW